MREMGIGTPGRELRNRLASVCLRTSSGSRRKVLAIEGNEEDLGVVAAMPQSLSKLATPRSLQHTASPSIRQLRTFSCSTAWRMSG